MPILGVCLILHSEKGIYMKAYIGIKYHKDYSNKPTVDKISSILEGKGYETICIIKD